MPVNDAGATQGLKQNENAATGELDTVPNDRRLLARWASEQNNNGHKWSAIHNAIKSAGYPIGENRSGVRMMNKLFQWASD